MQKAFGMGTHVVDFFQPGNVHQSGAGADRLMVIGQVAGIGPGSAHTIPVFQVRAECAVALGECRNTP
ncbi:hypothetical protein D9M72_640770 [compost metagenome]